MTRSCRGFVDSKVLRTNLFIPHVFFHSRNYTLSGGQTVQATASISGLSTCKLTPRTESEQCPSHTKGLQSAQKGDVQESRQYQPIRFPAHLHAASVSTSTSQHRLRWSKYYFVSTAWKGRNRRTPAALWLQILARLRSCVVQRFHACRIAERVLFQYQDAVLLAVVVVRIAIL